MALTRGFSRVDPEGTMVIPSHIRRELGLRPGQLVELKVTGLSQAQCLVVHHRGQVRPKRERVVAGLKNLGGQRNMGLKGLADIKTMQKAKIHSLPLKTTSKYLKLYALRMEKHRLQQYKAIMDKTKQRTDATLEDIEREMEEIVLSVAEEERANKETKNRTPNQRMKTMPLDY